MEAILRGKVLITAWVENILLLYTLNLSIDVLSDKKILIITPMTIWQMA